MDLTKYYEDICKHEMLNLEQEKELFAIYHNPESSHREKEQAKAKIISANLRYAFKKAKDFSRNDSSQFEDLIAAGNEGLIVGFDKFNHKSGVKFLTYAAWWVMQKQLKAMSSVRTVAVPIWKQQLSARIMKVQEGLEKPLSIEELCEQFPEVPRKDIEELSKTRYLTYHFDDVSDNEKIFNPFEEFINDEVEAGYLQKMLKKLPEEYARILELTFGFDDGKERKAASISREMGMPKNDVREKRNQALEMLKEMITGEMGEEGS